MHDIVRRDATGQPFRLPAPAGLYLDRSTTVRFTFEGRTYEGVSGDTLASALLANGVHLMSRSFKYHRPRGPLTMAGLDANTYVQVGPEPNVLADRLPVTDGLVALGQNYVGSLDNDRDRWMKKLARFMPVGFYYRTFYRPRGAWKFWERVIRAKAGLGRIDTRAPHGYYDKAYLFADVAVIGGGPAGLRAAKAAAEAGAEVLLVDDQPRLGGSLNYARFGRLERDGAAEAARLADELAAHPRVQVLTEATCTGLFTDNWLAVLRHHRMYKVRAAQVVIATGSVEQPMVFRNNDLPGVLLSSAVQRTMRLYGVSPGQRAVVCTANDEGYDVALDMLETGIEVAVVADLRAAPEETPVRAALGERGVRLLDGHTVWEAVPARDGKRVAAAVVDRVTGDGTVAGQGERIACDLVVTAVGYSPLGHLVCHAGGHLAYDEELASFAVAKTPPGVRLAGSVNHTFDRDHVFADGDAAGRQAAADAGFAGKDPAPAAAPKRRRMNHPWPIFPHPDGKDFVDFDEDQTVADIHNAIADGFEHIELIKRYTTVGMGPSQGRHSALNAVRIATRAKGQPLNGAVVTTQRPPFRPESFALLAGRGFEPVRYTAMHHRHVELGAEMMPAGLWLRPAFYGKRADRDRLIAEEAAAVRENVGMIDVSTLGGLEVRGPDAAEMMNRMYTFAYKKQPVGRSRYVLMTDQTGAIIDDGVACRFADDHFYVTATTSGVDAVYRAMLRWNAEWRLDVDIANVTAAYAGINIAGPRSREVLRTLECDIDLSPEAFPYIEVRTGTLTGIPVRMLRVGFVGELGYEIHCPASYGQALWDILMEAGKPFGIRPFGVEAQRLLRLEKGHIIVGQDTDGLTTPFEAEMAWAVGRKKPFFIGKRALDIQMADRPLSRRLVGFRMAMDAPLPNECNLVIRDDAIVGRVTSVARSKACNGTIGLAYVHPDDAEPGSTIRIKLDDGRYISAEVVPHPFYDPDNKRQEM